MCHLPQGLYHVRAAWLGVACLAGASLTAQTPSQPVAQFSSAVHVVEVYATVTDANGRAVTGLRRDDFEVSEDGQPQEIGAFLAGEFPVTVVLGVDRSWSMAGEPLRLAKDASRAFLRQLGPADRSMVVAISNQAEVIAPLSSDHARQMRDVAALDPWSTTSLHDALIAMLERIEGERGRLALVVFSDGIDRYSTAPASAVIDRARQTPALIYPITLGRTRPPLAAELAVTTGGRSFLLRDARELDETFGSIARELRNQYLIGYTPSRGAPPGAPEWRSIRVRVRSQAGLTVRARDGYMTR